MSSAQTVNSCPSCSSVAPGVVRPSCLGLGALCACDGLGVWGLGSEGLRARRYGGLGAWGPEGLGVWGNEALGVSGSLI